MSSARKTSGGDGIGGTCVATKSPRNCAVSELSRFDRISARRMRPSPPSTSGSTTTSIRVTAVSKVSGSSPKLAMPGPFTYSVDASEPPGAKRQHQITMSVFASATRMSIRSTVPPSVRSVGPRKLVNEPHLPAVQKVDGCRVVEHEPRVERGDDEALRSVGGSGQLAIRGNAVCLVVNRDRLRDGVPRRLNVEITVLEVVNHDRGTRRRGIPGGARRR